MENNKDNLKKFMKSATVEQTIKGFIEVEFTPESLKDMTVYSYTMAEMCEVVKEIGVVDDKEVTPDLDNIKLDDGTGPNFGETE